MTPGELQSLLQRNPFRPFTVYMSDGSSFEVPTSEYAFVTKSDLHLGIMPDDEGWPTQGRLLNIRQITRIDTQPEQPAA